jgi:hypothetical protein
MFVLGGILGAFLGLFVAAMLALARERTYHERRLRREQRAHQYDDAYRVWLRRRDDENYHTVSGRTDLHDRTYV